MLIVVMVCLLNRLIQDSIYGIETLGCQIPHMHKDYVYQNANGEVQ